MSTSGDVTDFIEARLEDTWIRFTAMAPVIHKILKIHNTADAIFGYGYGGPRGCDGCGMDGCGSDYLVDDINDCATLNAIAELWVDDEEFGSWK
ncbi:hypothetical protein GCM10010149_88260 [Nonomuraea roseoviolacea subsp. roseoviolacea]|uniref:hypothetical protein n=1 Tax=Nonomuraea roseoviolacea TaxID=103837 RepID=UPI0031D52368